MKRKLKIFWMSIGGSWIRPLLEELKSEVDIEVFLITNNESETKIENGVTFHYVHNSNTLCSSSLSAPAAQIYLDIINTFKPDLIHVHGTELNMGQIYRFLSDIPVVVSVQGILTECFPVSTNGLTKFDMKPFRTLKNLLGRGGLYSMEKRWKHGSETYELDIIRNNHYFFCRTHWDKAFVKKHNPEACIFHGEELLRPAFYNNAGKWRLDRCIPHRIFTTAGFNPIKGLHYAIKTLAEVKKLWPNVSMVIPGTQMHVFAYRGLKQRIFGEEYVGYCNHLIDKLGVRENVIFLPYLDDKQMVEELLKANVFLSATSIDNSPNALGEAMMIGVPAVVTPVGGIPSIIEHEVNGLLTVPNQMSENINRVFLDINFIQKISQNAYATALVRHDIETTKKQYLNAYNSIISNFNT